MTNNDRAKVFRVAIKRLEEDDDAFNLRVSCRNITGIQSGGPLYQTFANVKNGRIKSLKKDLISQLAKEYPKFGIFFDEEKAKLVAENDKHLLKQVDYFIEKNDHFILSRVEKIEASQKEMAEKQQETDELLSLILRRITNIERKLS